MKRREFIAGIGGVAAWPLVARPQQAAVPVLGFADNTSLATKREFIAAFHRGLAEIGYVEGRNLAIEYRWAEGHYDRLPALVADLVRRPVSVIVAAPTSTALAAKAATSKIPIVFQIGSDPVEIGLVASLNRPGSNLTGVATLNADVVGKRFQMLHELVPAARSIAYLVNPANPIFAQIETRDVQLAANALAVHLLVLNASSEGDIVTAFSTLIRERADALLVGADTLFNAQREQIITLAARHNVPTSYQYREFVPAGGLMSYGPPYSNAYRLVGHYTGRILNGEKPADLPVQQSTTVELVINLKTAKSLGLTIPETLLATADEVIQ
jgi:putative ABC transport system substrate-binding protein